MRTTPMTRADGATLALRATMEVGIVAALGMWGYHAGSQTLAKLLLAVLAPVVGFGIWGAVDFRWAGRVGEPLRLAEELAISLSAACAWYAAGSHLLGAGLAALTVSYHGLVYLSGGRLLKEGGLQ